MALPEVVITGLGCISPHGRGTAALWAGLLEGRSAFRPVDLFDASMFRNPLAGTVAGYPPASAPAVPSRAVRMLLDAADEALRDALDLPPESGADDIAARVAGDEGMRGAFIVTGTNFGGMSVAETALVEGRGDISKASLDGYLFGVAGEALAGRFGLVGPHVSHSLSCASGTAAIGLACDAIRRGRAAVALAGGYDELSLYIYAGLSALRAITPETIRPFDRRRKGTLFSEGAGVMVLESAAHAAARKAPRVYARVLGRAMNNDAYHMTAPEQEGHGIQALMRAALADAGVPPDQIAHLNLHATGTPYNDAIETKAVHAVFGARGREIPVCSVKSSIGHCMGAAGILEAAAAVLTMRDGKVPPVLGLDPAEKDPACDLCTPTGKPLEGVFRTVLKTSYGFGGTNAAVVLARG
ncbi:MAG: beta-ketoacyl-[acyl-carrier-protein] synthase family protein [Planctomycetota bacterium]|nr:beta-ketoacyl-[acyl-carrier-protein] synthase family protein [Planctomycetota bacterium]